MRIIGFPTSPNKPRFHRSRWSRCQLPAAFVGVLISLFAFPVNAQSSNFVGCRFTDEDFRDRLHHNFDWMAGLDFPANDDRMTSQLESADAERGVKAVEERSEVSLENEILDSVCEVFHLNACEGFQGLWAPGLLEESKGRPQNPGGGFDVAGIVNDSFRRSVSFVGDSRNLLVRNWQQGEESLAQITELLGLSTLVLDLQLGLANSNWAIDGVLKVWNIEKAQVGTAPKVRAYLANFATNLQWMAGHLEARVASWANWREPIRTGSMDLSWPAGFTVSAANFGTSPFDWSVKHRQEPPIQPVPAASYVGLERAIDFGFRQVKIRIDRWRYRGLQLATGTDWLAKLQKDAFERVVLKQFDAILR